MPMAMTGTIFRLTNRADPAKIKNLQKPAPSQAEGRVSKVKQKINGPVAILLLLIVIGVVGAVMYYSSEPPVIGGQVKSPVEWRQQMEATRRTHPFG